MPSIAIQRTGVCLVTADYRRPLQTTTDYRRPMSMFTADQRKLQENVKLTTFTQIRNINGRCARRSQSVF